RTSHNDSTSPRPISNPSSPSHPQSATPSIPPRNTPKEKPDSHSREASPPSPKHLPSARTRTEKTFSHSPDQAPQTHAASQTTHSSSLQKPPASAKNNSLHPCSPSTATSRSPHPVPQSPRHFPRQH